MGSCSSWKASDYSWHYNQRKTQQKAGADSHRQIHEIGTCEGALTTPPQTLRYGPILDSSPKPASAVVVGLVEATSLACTACTTTAKIEVRRRQHHLCSGAGNCIACRRTRTRTFSSAAISSSA